MKKKVIYLIAACLVIGVTAFLTIRTFFSSTEESSVFAEDQTSVGNLVGVSPVDGFTVNENMDALSASGIYYITWTSGEGRTITNDSDEEAVLYDAQVYVLLKECESEDAAASDIASWIALEQENYLTGEESALTKGSQEYRILPLSQPQSDSNPYACGAAAFAVRGDLAVTVECLVCEDYPEEPEEVLAQFLEAMQYADELS